MSSPHPQSRRAQRAHLRLNMTYWATCALGCALLTVTRHVLLLQDIHVLGIVGVVGVAWFMSMATLLCLSVRMVCVVGPNHLALTWSMARGARQ